MDCCCVFFFHFNFFFLFGLCAQQKWNGPWEGATPMRKKQKCSVCGVWVSRERVRMYNVGCECVCEVVWSPVRERERKERKNNKRGASAVYENFWNVSVGGEMVHELRVTKKSGKVRERWKWERGAESNYKGCEPKTSKCGMRVSNVDICECCEVKVRKEWGIIKKRGNILIIKIY